MAWPETPQAAVEGGPLEGMRVLDLSRVLAGPFAAMILGDLGADVMKIERPGVGDETRRWGPPFVTDPQGEEVGTYYYAANRNKRSVEIDLSSDEGRRLLDELCRDADVLLHNFLPRVAAKLGLDPEELRERHPHLVVASISGFGGDGEYADRPGFDFVIQAMSGLMSITGPEDGEPTKVGVAISDVTAGMYAAIGILAAVTERQRSGKGRCVEVSLLESQVSLLVNQAMNYLLGGVEPERMGNAHPNIAPYETYETYDRKIAIGVGTDKQFRNLCEAIGSPELAEDERFATNADRVENRKSLKDELEAHLGDHPVEDWLDRLWDADVPCGPVNTIANVFDDPLVRDLVVEIDGVTQVGTPLKFDGDRPDMRLPPPALGADNQAVSDILRSPRSRDRR